jgi:hypothetical protein
VVRYAIMTFGGFLGIGEGEHPLPWKSFRYDTNLGGYVANVTEEQLQNAPEYAGEESWSDRDWETRLKQELRVYALLGGYDHIDVDARRDDARRLVISTAVGVKGRSQFGFALFVALYSYGPYF